MKKKLLIHNGSISIGGQEKMLIEFLKVLNPEKYEVLLLIEQNIGKDKNYVDEIPEWIRYSFLTSKNLIEKLENNRRSKNPFKRIYYSFLLSEKKRKAAKELKRYLDFSDIIIDFNMGLLRNIHKLELKDKTLVGWSHAGNGELPKSSCKRKNTERYDYIVAINERMKKGYEKSTKRPQIVKLYNFMELESIIEKSKIAIPEKFKYIVLEAMTLKTMVIATKTDGTREILGEDSQYGKLVESSKEDLKREILYYLKNREKRRVYEELGYTRAKDFSKDNAITKIEEFIDRL